MNAPGDESHVVREFAVVRLDGDIDAANITVTQAALLAGVGMNLRGLVIDLSRTRYIDSAGVQMIFEVRRDLELRRQTLGLVVAEESPIHMLVKLTRLDEAVQCCTSVTACVDALEAEPG